ncbi:hypothetical protein HK405_004207, partial [Cladochytrium tenue]
LLLRRRLRCYQGVRRGRGQRRGGDSRPNFAPGDNGRRDGESRPDEVEGTDNEDDDDNDRRWERGGAFCSGTIGMAEVDDE